MANLATNKKYLNLDGVRVSYQPKDNTIHITSTDDDFPEGFHLTLTQGSPSEDKLRSLLTEHGLIRNTEVEDKLPKFIDFNKAIRDSAWHKFPLGRNEKEEIYWDAHSNPNLLVLGNKGSGRTVLRNLLLNHINGQRDNWSKPIIINGTIADSINDDDYLDKLDQKIRKINDLIVKRLFPSDKFIPLGSDKYPKRVLIVVEDLNKIINNPLVNQRARTSIQSLNATITHLSIVGNSMGLHLAMLAEANENALPDEAIMKHMSSRVILKRASKELSLKVLDNYDASKTVSGIVGRGVYQNVNGFTFPFQTYYFATPEKKEEEESKTSSLTVTSTRDDSNPHMYIYDLEYATQTMDSILRKEGSLEFRELLKKTRSEIVSMSFPELNSVLNDALATGEFFRDKHNPKLIHRSRK
jgi:hypothetical protein